jgi:hypothetical protein
MQTYDPGDGSWNGLAGCGGNKRGSASGIVVDPVARSRFPSPPPPSKASTSASPCEAAGNMHAISRLFYFILFIYSRSSRVKEDLPQEDLLAYIDHIHAPS